LINFKGRSMAVERVDKIGQAQKNLFDR
jgi:hypothetical protein